MKRYPSPKLASRMYFYKKTELKIELNFENTKNCPYLEKRLETSQYPQNFNLKRYL